MSFRDHPFIPALALGSAGAAIFAGVYLWDVENPIIVTGLYSRPAMTLDVEIAVVGLIVLAAGVAHAWFVLLQLLTSPAKRPSQDLVARTH